ncbi:MAG TPA: hypothetical protein VNA57_00115 [Acidimicrobiales bacterium]|nr:hypothetical protein [Acidimicrobiales bacterium]
MKSWLDRLLETAVALVAVGLLLNWAWQLIEPLAPVLLVSAGLAVIVPAVVRWRQGW